MSDITSQIERMQQEAAGASPPTNQALADWQAIEAAKTQKAQRTQTPTSAVSSQTSGKSTSPKATGESAPAPVESPIPENDPLFSEKIPPAPAKKKVGRPKGSKNKSKLTPLTAKVLATQIAQVVQIAVKDEMARAGLGLFQAQKETEAVPPPTLLPTVELSEDQKKILREFQTSPLPPPPAAQVMETVRSTMPTVIPMPQMGPLVTCPPESDPPADSEASPITPTPTPTSMIPVDRIASLGNEQWLRACRQFAGNLRGGLIRARAFLVQAGLPPVGTWPPGVADQLDAAVHAATTDPDTLLAIRSVFQGPISPPKAVFLVAKITALATAVRLLIEARK